jgi:hypothetical protein
MSKDPGAETSGIAAAIPLPAAPESGAPAQSLTTVISTLLQAPLIVPILIDILT